MLIENVVVILDPKGVISGDLATRRRHELYAKTLRELAPNYRLYVATAEVKLTSGNEPINNEIFFCFGPPTHNFINFAFKVSRFLKSNFRETSFVLVSGDPWESFFSSFILKILLNGKVHTQVQIHAEVANSTWIRNGMKNRLKFLMAGIGFQLADQVRTVSQYQTNEIIKKYRLDPRKIRIIPPPIQLSVISKFSVPPRPESIGFVGRMQDDRGTNELILLTYKLNQVNKSFQIVLVGDGPDRSYLEAKLRDIVGINRLISLGKLHDVELQVAFRKIGVLVSLSQTESYGRTIRESIAYGVPVWGTHTSGLKQLNDEYASSGLEFINLADSPELLNIQFQQLLNSNIDENYGINIAVEDSRRISNLCKSWIEISSQERKVNLNDSE